MLKTLSPLLLIIVLPAFSASASLAVIADLGGESTAPLFSAIEPEPEHRLSPPAAIPLEEAVFPVISSRLSPGAFTPRALSLPGMTPLFLMGDDPLSLRWLSEKQAMLISLDATGLVVNVASAERLQRLRENAGALTLLPVSGDDLAERLQLKHYPVLITGSGLSQ